MVSGERLVLSTLLAGIYLPGIEEIYLSSSQCPERWGITGRVDEDHSCYQSRPQGSEDCFKSSPASGIDSHGIQCPPWGRANAPSFELKDSLALYGGGGRLVDLLRERSPGLAEAPELLRRHGFASEAARLERIGLLDLARQFVLEGAVLTPFHPEAEWIWNCGAALPYALWCAKPALKSSPAEFPQRLFAVVGSRQVDLQGQQGAVKAALALQQGGWTLITGGAAGVDSIALEAVGETMTPRGVVLHPNGLGTAAGLKLRHRWPWAWHLSLCPPWQLFEARSAHQRNRVIFALSEGALSIGPRRGQGGTWSGAIECLKNRLAPMAVLAGSGDKAALTALIHLGALEVSLEELDSPRGPAVIGRIVQQGLLRKHSWAGLGSWGSGVGQGSLFRSEVSARLAAYGEPQRSNDSGGLKEEGVAYSPAPSIKVTAA